MHNSKGFMYQFQTNQNNKIHCFKGKCLIIIKLHGIKYQKTLTVVQKTFLAWKEKFAFN